MTIQEEYQNYCLSVSSPLSYPNWLEVKLLDLRSERDAIYSELWNQHILWMSSFINRAQERGMRLDDAYKLMTSEDRAANRRFNDLVHPIVNPHLKGEKL